MAEVLNIALQELGRYISAGSKRHMLDIHLCLKQVWGKVDVGVYQVLGEHHLPKM